MGLLDDAIREHLDLKRKRGADPGEIERLEREALGPVRRDPLSHVVETLPHLEVQPEYEAVDLQLELQPDEFGLGPDPSQLDQTHDESPAPERRRGLFRRHRSAPAAPAPTEHAADFDAVEHDDFAALLYPDVDEEPDLQEPPDHESAPEPYVPVTSSATPPESSVAEPEPPPPLTFETPPPKRPRFSARPPADVEDELGEPPAGDDMQERASAAPQPKQASQPGTVPESDESAETTEWDVEDAFAAEDGTHTTAAGDSGQDSEDDVLEETPEFLQDTPDHDRLWFEQRPPRDFDFDG